MIGEFCCVCGAPAVEYEPLRMAVYCRCHALEIAEDVFKRKSDDDKLEAAGFENIEEYGR